MRENSKKKIALVDIGGNVSFSLGVGIALDFLAGLSPLGILTSRATATGFNSVTGGPYGWWREKVYDVTRTNNQGGKVRKTLVDLLAFNTFQVPAYSFALAVGSFVSEGQVDWGKVRDGAAYLTTVSPFLGPVMGWYMDKFRGWFNVDPAAQGAYKNYEIK